MKYNLNVVSAYRGITKYINAVRTAENPDMEQLWLKYVIDPFWNEWAAGQFNEIKYRSQLSKPIEDIQKLEEAVNELTNSGIEEILRNAYDKIVSALPLPTSVLYKAICIYPDIEIGESMHGIFGNCVGDHLLIRVNPVISQWQDYIPWVLAHLYNHSIWGYHYYYLDGNRERDLLTAIISEGQADSFAHQICPELKPIWISALTPEQELKQWTLIKEYLYCRDSMELIYRFFYGDEKKGTPPNAGYTIGFNIVQMYLKTHPTVSFNELIDINTRDIYEESGYDGVNKA